MVLLSIIMISLFECAAVLCCLRRDLTKCVCVCVGVGVGVCVCVCVCRKRSPAGTRERELLCLLKSFELLTGDTGSTHRGEAKRGPAQLSNLRAPLWTST